MYDLLFSYPLNQVIKRKNPNVIVCTHALPSRIVSFLKQKEKTDVIAINVYTDYFINKVWAIQGIDYHLVSTPRMKKALIDQGVSEASIFLTGIPVHPVFRGNNYKVKKKIVPKSILVSGGSLGIGAIKKSLLKTERLHYYVLCGKSKKTYNQLKKWNKRNITPIKYVHDRITMNELYDKVDGILTKAGGVTVSESIVK